MSLHPLFQAALAPMAPKRWADPDTCLHVWRVIHDYEGDPGVINGIHTFTFRSCSRCGLEEDGVDGDEPAQDDREPDDDDRYDGRFDP
jgi:hypothetical protein